MDGKYTQGELIDNITLTNDIITQLRSTQDLSHLIVQDLLVKTSLWLL